MKFWNSEIEMEDSIDFDPSQYKSKAGAAKALYKALCAKAVEYGMAESEVFIRSPEENSQAGWEKCWKVSWEAGPYEWAISASFNCANSPYWFTEPYYSFDLDFAE